MVRREKAEETARCFGIPYFKMDTETGKGVEHGFRIIVREFSLLR
jgi:hypothetical protein